VSIPVLTKFAPQTIAKVYSPINGEISVIELMGRKKIMVGGLTQSGPMAEEVWAAAVGELRKDLKSSPEKILLLGVCGGSLAKLLELYFPKSQITGIDIDPLMVSLGEKYLGLSHIKNLQVEISDAADYLLYALRHKLLFDLIFVDLYLGDRVPENCQSQDFLLGLKNILKKEGTIVFNRLYYNNHVFEAEKFLDKLSKIFNDLVCRKVLTNFFVFAKKNKR
jgi:spermidine synthase